jgi:hypothetical protein
MQIAYIHFVFCYWRFNHRILLQIVKIMCKKCFKKVDYIDCKIIAFEMKKKAFFIPCKTGSSSFECSWLKKFVLHKVDAFDTMLGN